MIMEGGAPLSAERVLARTFLRSDRSAGLKRFQGLSAFPAFPAFPVFPSRRLSCSGAVE
jgi:hypothetical protein